ncbi:VOC family protein [Frondihabitans australicus]|uniref:Putative 3-demethylubiquinone-9 3-methyltransferase (Glyoxalase superfamily) n=1 Tax=Frondihabitans australicus TaxID=386892 RepID=A0A495IEQ1_9MICO|nr:VOC family protein [Frondihabitans australicus]RKR73978.1 putative 3-demethylubiquinone-9 3-methyltransferase (glyoxalase superfamily) [Frondihabitans australicus]
MADQIDPLRIEPQLMFTGDAQAAIDLYTSAFGGSAIEHVQRADDGTIAFAAFSLAGQRFRCIDSAPVHDFTFTPSISLAVDCAQAADVDALVGVLAADGQVFMPLDTYPFNERYAWVADRFGVSWQIGVGAA